MANTLRFKRGLASGLPTGLAGEPLFTTDTFDLYIGNGTGNTRFQKYIASGTTGQLLRGDGSLLTMPIVLTSPANGQVLKFNGTNWVNDSDAGITGSGTTNFLPRFTGATTLGNSTIFQGTRSLGFNTATPVDFGAGTYNLHLHDDGIPVLQFTNSTTGQSSSVGSRIQSNGNDLLFINSQTTGVFRWNTNGAERMRLHATGNLHLGGTSDNGLRFQVTGDGYFSGSVGIGASTGLTDINLRITKALAGSVFPTSISVAGTIAQAATTGAVYVQTSAITEAATFTLPNLYHFRSTQGTFGAGSTVTNQYGYIAESSLIGATNNYGFYGNIASGTGRWNLYMNGTAANYLAGNTGIGNSNPIYKLDVFADTSVEPVATPVDNYAARFRRTYTNNNASVGARRWNTYIDTTYNGNQAFTNASGLFSYINYANTNASSVINAIANYIEPTSSSAASTIRGNINQLGLGGTITNAIGYYSYLISLTAGTTTNVKLFQADAIGTTNTITNLYGYIAESTLTNATNNYAFFGNIASASGRWNFYAAGTAANYFNGNTIIGGTATDAGFKLDVNGTMRVSGASTFGANSNLSLNQNAGTFFRVQNTTSGTGSYSELIVQSDASSGSGSLGKVSSTYTTYKLLTAGSTYIYNGTAGNIALQNDFASGSIVMAAGGSSTAHFTIASTGAATFSSTARAAGFITSGGTGYAVINSAATTVTALRPTGGGSSIMSTNSNGLHIAVGTQAAGDLILASNNTERIRLSQNGFFSQLNATNPSASITDSYIQYSADVVAGNAAPHFRTENGAVIKLYQETTAVGNAIVGAGGGSAMLDDDTFDGYTLRQVVRALRNQGILQ